MERLLVHTIYVRTKARLQELLQEFQDALGPSVECKYEVFLCGPCT